MNSVVLNYILGFIAVVFIVLYLRERKYFNTLMEIKESLADKLEGLFFKGGVMELNGTEIDLINQIARKYRKPVSKGGWYEFKGSLYLLHTDSNHLMSSDCIPIWTVSDCLEFLKSKDYYCSIYDQVGGGTIIDIFLLVEGQRSMQDQLHGATLLEACLLAVLVVLEDKGITFEKGDTVYRDEKGNLVIKKEG